MSGAYEGQQIVGMDLHRRRSVLVRMTEAGERLETVRISNDLDYLRQVMARAGEAPEVVLEAAYGWYWAADTLAELGASVHLAHPLGVKMFSLRRVKNDERDAADLADLLRMGRLPEAWIAPPATRELRGWVRHRAKLVGLRSGLKNQVHAVLASAGVQVVMSDLFGPGGQQLLAATALAVESRSRVDSLLRVINVLDFEIDTFARLVAGRLRADPGYVAIQAIPGVGPLLGAVFVAGQRRGAHRHDSPLLDPTLDQLDELGPLPDEITVHLDSGYDSGKTRDKLDARGLNGEIARKGEKAPIQASQRWHVERTNAWHNGFNRLQRCYERREAVAAAFFDLADAIITVRSLIRRAWTTQRWDARSARRP